MKKQILQLSIIQFLRSLPKLILKISHSIRKFLLPFKIKFSWKNLTLWAIFPQTITDIAEDLQSHRAGLDAFDTHRTTFLNPSSSTNHTQEDLDYVNEIKPQFKQNYPALYLQWDVRGVDIYR